MKKKEQLDDPDFLTRTKLVNPLYSDRVYEPLPKIDKAVFDNFPSFQRDKRSYTDLSFKKIIKEH